MRGVAYVAGAFAGVSLSSFVGCARVRHARERKQWATRSPAGSGGRKRSETVAHASARRVTSQGWPLRSGTRRA